VASVSKPQLLSTPLPVAARRAVTTGFDISVFNGASTSDNYGAGVIVTGAATA
jgi:hypothetical protein